MTNSCQTIGLNIDEYSYIKLVFLDFKKNLEFYVSI